MNSLCNLQASASCTLLCKMLEVLRSICALDLQVWTFALDRLHLHTESQLTLMMFGGTMKRCSGGPTW